MHPGLGHPLPRAFYERSAVVLARAVLGRLLVCEGPEGRVGGVIVETEAYRGARDPASHAWRGVTPRNRVMFGPPGHAYVYFIYGAHLCLNLVAEAKGRAAAVLVRALAPFHGEDLMRRRRGVGPAERLARGPGNLGRALGLTRGHDGSDLTRGPIWLSDQPPRRFGRVVAAGPRIGVRRGLERRWRFYLKWHPCVSGPRGPGARKAGPGGRQIPVDTLAGRSYYPLSVHRAPR
jgi:DNA-3-methyladenine glycosylase